jgi:hypothetical protein
VEHLTRVIDCSAALGGTVHWFGKPYPAVYTTGFDILGGIDKSRIMAVGVVLYKALSYLVEVSK